jgi:hypothetical protein
VAKLMQNEQVVRAMMTIVQVGKVNTFTTEQTERFARPCGNRAGTDLKRTSRT